MKVLRQIKKEVERQEELFGVQRHPDGTGAVWAEAEADHYRQICNVATRNGMLTWADILREEVFEAFAESDPEKLRTELIQVAAIAVSWCEALDRRDD